MGLHDRIKGPIGVASAEEAGSEPSSLAAVRDTQTARAMRKVAKEICAAPEVAKGKKRFLFARTAAA